MGGGKIIIGRRESFYQGFISTSIFFGSIIGGHKHSLSPPCPILTSTYQLPPAQIEPFLSLSPFHSTLSHAIHEQPIRLFVYSKILDYKVYQDLKFVHFILAQNYLPVSGSFEPTNMYQSPMNVVDHMDSDLN